MALEKILLYVMLSILLPLNCFAQAEQNKKIEKRSLLLVPAFSFFIPGLGSFLERDYATGAKFLGYEEALFSMKDFVFCVVLITANQPTIHLFYESGRNTSRGPS